MRLALAILIALVWAAPAAAQQLPDGAGKDTTVKVCGTCHPPERGASVRLTREGWQDVIVRMVGIGAKGTDEELTAVLDYLFTHFKGAAAAPLNLNRATPQELQAIAGMLRRESAAWIAHRTKAPCAAVDDLKTVAGIDFARIEKRRDRLVCF